MKTFTKQEIRDLLNKVIMDEVSFTRMVEIMNERVDERVSEAEKPCVEDIPVRKFKKGDKVRIKEGISSKTHCKVSPGFVEEMDVLIGKTMSVNDGYIAWGNYVDCEGIHWSFPEEWLEPYVEELKKSDLAIFWDDDKGWAFVGKYNGLLGNGSSFPHQDHRENVWKNAIKFESKEQYERLIKGEI